MQIIKPNKKYLSSYYEACKIMWGNIHDNYLIHNPDKYNEWKHHIFENFENNEKGINLPMNFVPSKTYWLVDNNEYIGTLNFREKLNKSLLIYGGHAGCVIRPDKRNKGYCAYFNDFIFKKIMKSDIETLLLTCENTNIISQKILRKLNPTKIEQDKIMLHDKLTPVLRFFYKINK